MQFVYNEITALSLSNNILVIFANLKSNNQLIMINNLIFHILFSSISLIISFVCFIMSSINHKLINKRLNLMFSNSGENISEPLQSVICNNFHRTLIIV